MRTNGLGIARESQLAAIDRMARESGQTRSAYMVQKALCTQKRAKRA